MVSKDQGTFDVAGGIAPALPALTGLYSTTNAFVVGGGGGGSIGSEGQSIRYQMIGIDSISKASNGTPGAVLVQKAHPATSSLF